MAGEPAIVVKDLDMGYGDFVLMRNLNFTVNRGDVFIIMGGSGFTQTFAELDAAANRLSHLLRAAGVQPGDHVAICMENHDRYMEIVWGCHYAGAVYTACSSRLTSGELSYIVNDCTAKVFITSKYKADQAAEVLPEIGGAALRLMLDGTVDGYESYEAAVAAQPATALPNRIAGTDAVAQTTAPARAQHHRSCRHPTCRLDRPACRVRTPTDRGHRGAG